MRAFAPRETYDMKLGSVAPRETYDMEPLCSIIIGNQRVQEKDMSKNCNTIRLITTNCCYFQTAVTLKLLIAGNKNVSPG
jgi:hypothetical protein